MVKLRSFVWAPMAEYGENITLVKHRHTLMQADKPEVVPSADFSYGIFNTIEPDSNGFSEHGLRLDADGRIRSGIPAIWVLHNVSVQRVSLNRNRYHIVLRDGVCADDAYHDGRWIGRRLGEVQDVDIRSGESVTINVMDDVPIGAEVEQPTVMLSHLNHENYAHAIHETLSRFWPEYFETTYFDDNLLLWDRPTSEERQLQKLFHKDRLFVELPAPRTLYRKLIVPALAAPYCVGRFQLSFLRHEIGRLKLPRGGKKYRTYVSRADASQRQVTNETALLALLAEFDFVPLILTGLPIQDAVEFFSHAECVLLPHGAGAINVLFAPEGCRVIELIPDIYQHPMFHLLSKWSGHWYGRLLCSTDERHNITVDLEAVRLALAAAGVLPRSGSRASLAQNSEALLSDEIMEHAPGLSKVSVPARFTLSRIITHQGTAICFDPEGGSIRHSGANPRFQEVVLAQSDEDAYLFHAVDGALSPIRIQNSGLGLQETCSNESDYEAAKIEVIPIGRQVFGLRKRNLFLCAEPDGRITLSRHRLDQWERFQRGAVEVDLGYTTSPGAE